MRSLIVFLLTTIALQVFSQESLTLKGKVVEASSNEPLPGASLLIPSLQKGSSTNNQGNFSFTVPLGQIEIKASFIGYVPVSKTLNIASDTSVVLKMSPENIMVKDVEVQARKKNSNIESKEVGVSSLDAKEIEELPSLMGKPDVINALRQTPGIQSVGEGNAGIYVRGGDAGQNLILLDNMPLYNPSHLLGFFPVFNAGVIREARVTKGGIPAYYGGKAAAIIDIDMKEGSHQQFGGSGSIGLLSADATLETPINKGRGSLLLSGRRTYFEALKSLSSQFIKEENNFFSNTGYYFYDATAKFNYRITNNSRVYLTAYHSNDDYKLTDEEFDIKNDMVWSNSAAAFRYNHVFNNRLISDFSLGFTHYFFNMDSRLTKYTFQLYSEILDYNSNLDFTWFYSPENKIKFGAAYIKHRLTPNKIDVDVEDINFKNTNRYYSDEASVYVNGDITINEKLSAKAGMRLTLYRHLGPYTHYLRDETGQLSDSIVYEKNQAVQNYFRPNPFLSWVYLLNKEASVKGSMSYTHQYIHLASVGTVSLPTDVWLPSTSFIKPQNVGIISVGYYRNFFENLMESSVDVYYKHLGNQIDFLNGVLDNFDNAKIEDNIISGTGNAFGFEFFVKKQWGKSKGWVSYTLSRTTRKFEQINSGDAFPAKYDRTHDLSVTFNHEFNKKWRASAAFVFATGNAMTLPEGRYIIQGNVANDYTQVNAYRMPAYHRLDLSAKYELATTEKWKSSLVFSVYNVYNRSNPYYIYFRVKSEIDNYYLNVQPKQISLFPILPSITWNFEF